MLTELYLQNFVIFERGELLFTAGLNVISGETGAGKSLLAAALGLALGARANNEVIRSGNERAIIKAVFSLPENAASAALTEKLQTLAIADNDDNLLFERQLRLGGTTKISLNDMPVTIAAAREIAGDLLDIAAQNEHTRLFSPEYQLELLDHFGEISSATYREIFAQATEIVRRLAANDDAKEDARRESTRIQYQLKEIAAFDFSLADLQLTEQIAALANREKIITAAERGLSALTDDENSISAQIGAINRQLAHVAQYGKELTAAREFLTAAENSLAEAVRQLRAIEITELSDLDSLIAREQELKNLTHLLACDGGQIPEVEKKLQRRLDELANWEIDEHAAKKSLEKLSEKLLRGGAELRNQRLAAAEKLTVKVQNELRALEMPHAKFFVECTPFADFAQIKDDALAVVKNASAAGLDAVKFMIAPNLGEPAGELAQIASGGEQARLMLAIKSAFSEQHQAATLFFDEIDSGVGGRLGDALGKKLRTLAKNRQVIVITHLPQIAAYAHQHLRVIKRTVNGRVCASVEEVQGKQRVEEIAQMLNGAAATATTRKQAEEMLTQGRKYKD